MGKLSGYIGLVVMLVAAPVFAERASIDETRDAAPGGRVEVTVMRGTVSFRGWDNAQVQVKGLLDESTREFVFDRSGDETRIEVKVDQDEDRWSASEGAELTVFLPRSSSVALSGVATDVDGRDLTGRIEIGVVSGDIKLMGGGPVDLQSVSGDIDLRDVQYRVDVATVSGDIECAGCRGEGDFASVSGDIRLRDAGKVMEFATVSGDVEVQADALESVTGLSVSGDIDVSSGLENAGHIDFETVSGSIRLVMAGAINARFDLESDSGSIRNRLTDDKPSGSRFMQDESLRFSLGDGLGRITLATQSGDITLGQR